jgi:hypothetical protein
MTLMEVMSALVITGLMAMGGGAAFSALIDQQQVIARANTATERAAALRETLRTWIMSGQIASVSGGVPRGAGGAGGGRGAQSALRTVTPGGNNTGPVGVTAAVAAGDELDFTTVAAGPASSPTTTMRLFVDGDPNTPETGLTLEYQASVEAPLQRRQLDASITAITIEYLDRRTGRWYPASEANTIQPRAVRLTLTPADSVRNVGLLTLPMIIPLPGASTSATGQ